MPRIVNLSAIFRVRTPKAKTLLSIGYYCPQRCSASWVARLRRCVVSVDSTKRAQKPTALSAIGHGLLVALGTTLGNRVRSKVVPRLKQ